MPPQSEAGAPLPLGSHQQGTGINFAIFSRHATAVTLLLFRNAQDLIPESRLELDPQNNRTGDIWHLWLADVSTGSLYAWQVDGPNAPEQGDRFDRRKLLLDPYALALAGTEHWDFAGANHIQDKPNSDHTTTPKCLVTDRYFDWTGEQRLRHPWSRTIIYETHVRGLTIDPSSEVKHPGTYLGVIEKIPYLQDLGITAVELLPVQEFNQNELTRHNPRTGELLRNYWGYNTVSFFAPKESYASSKYAGAQVHEFKTMVLALHQAGIEVILDVVFNHTAEGDHTGPTLNFRGLDNRIYYLLETDRRFYKNFSGTGNTLNCNHPVVRDYILDCLRHWVIDMHVDGFRFDLAAIMERSEDGSLLANPPLLERIAEDPILRDVKLIAEAWDAAGVYQVGHFPGQRWSEWNGRYRDDVRRFWLGEAGMIGALASRLCGSADLYQQAGKEPLNSINFITCHDGFTLNDLVSYAYKHNEDNGEENQDGNNDNHSANYGIEGAGDDLALEALRQRQIRNMIATLLLSRGVPMLLGGDEFRRSQQGNNNAYCQDNEISWYNWRLLAQEHDTVNFTQKMIRLRQRFPLLSEEHFYTATEITWFNHEGVTPEWWGETRSLGCHIHPQGYPDELCLIFNAEQTAVDFNLPRPQRNAAVWQREIDTSTVDSDNKLPTQTNYQLLPHSLVVLATSN